MRIIWTKPARHDLHAIGDYIGEHNPRAAETVGNGIFQSVEKLLQFPMCGRPGRVTDTRELVIPGLPYIVVYLVDAPKIVILRVVHGAQNIQHWSEDLKGKLPS